MKLVIGGVAQGKLDYVLENMIEESEKYDVYDCFFLKDNACNDKASNMEWPPVRPRRSADRRAGSASAPARACSRAECEARAAADSPSRAAP